MKLCYATAVLFMLLAIQASHPQSEHSADLKLKEASFIITDSQKVNLTEKSPLLAGTLSFIVPGLALGQFYNGQILKGLLHVAISGLGIALFFSGFDIGGGHHYSTMTTLGFLLYLGNWIYTTFEAVAAAENINKQIKLQKYSTDVMDRLKFGLTVNKNKQFNLYFAFDL